MFSFNLEDDQSPRRKMRRKGSQLFSSTLQSASCQSLYGNDQDLESAEVKTEDVRSEQPSRLFSIDQARTTVIRENEVIDLTQDDCNEDGTSNLPSSPSRLGSSGQQESIPETYLPLPAAVPRAPISHALLARQIGRRPHYCELGERPWKKQTLVQAYLTQHLEDHYAKKNKLGEKVE